MTISSGENELFGYGATPTGQLACAESVKSTLQIRCELDATM
jgi:hypothetical protein